MTRDGADSSTAQRGERNDSDGAHESAAGAAPSPFGQRMRAASAAGPGVVEGAVIDGASGERVPFVDVIFRAPGGEVTANSGEEGEYSVELAGGSYQVRALGDGVVGLPQPVLRVAGVEVQRLASIDGQVVDHQGEAIGGAVVSLLQPAAQQP